MGALKIPPSLRLNSDIFFMIVLSVSRADPRQTVMSTDLQDGIKLCSGDFSRLKTLCKRRSGIEAVQGLVHAPLFALNSNWSITH